MPGNTVPLRNRNLMRIGGGLLLVLIAVRALLAQDAPETGAPTSRDPVAIAADYVQHWQHEGDHIWLLRGRCRITQGSTQLQSQHAVVWRKLSPGPGPLRDRLQVYLEGDVRVERPGQSQTENWLLFDLVTQAGLTLDKQRVLAQPAADDRVYLRAVERRGLSRRTATVQPAQYSGPAFPTPFDAPGDDGELRSVQLQPAAQGVRRLRIFPRSAVRFNVESFESRETTPPEQVWILSGGVNILIDGVQQTQGTVDLSADRIVLWTQMASETELTGEGTVQAAETPLQIYLEGNIIMRQGPNSLRATQGFYDARENRALLLNAELKSRIPNLAADVRVRASQLRQLSADTFQASQAWITTSQFGVPGYRLQTSDLLIEPWDDGPLFDDAPPRINPETGELERDTTPWATTYDNTFLVGNVPLFYTPYLSFPAEDPNIPLRNIRIANDRIFGTQVYTTWNMFKLFGLRRPSNTRWDLHLDYLSSRGPQVGSTASYSGLERFGYEGFYEGNSLAYFTYDTGQDRLGSDRLDLIPQQSARGRVNLRDRQNFLDGYTLLSEFSYLSDRNYLEQYSEIEFDTGKDYETLLNLSRKVDNRAWEIWARPRLYNYYNQSEFLPRGDFYLLSQPLLDGLVTWSNHSYATYANQRIADPPTDPNDKYSVLPFESNSEGGIFMTRQQVDMPFLLGPVKVVPYAMGEFSHWDEDLQGNALDRLYGVGGVRSSLEFWRVFPTVDSSLFNLSGLAHKLVLFADYSYAQSSDPLSRVPQYNEFDENAQEQFRRRFFFNTYNQNVPAQVEPRFFAVRTGAAQSVTAPYHELVDDRQALTFGIQQRLQTKRGPVNNQRIVNWMTLDLETTYFPDATRDNFGEPFGVYGARYNWYVGDRTSITASTYFDTFDNASRVWNLAFLTQRNSRGTVYVGYRNIETPALHSQILTASYSYIHSPKWVSTLATSYDIGLGTNLGQTVALTRVGADFLIHVGVSVDPTRDNFGVGLSVEPRFAPFSQTAGTGALGNLLTGGQPR